MNTNQSDGNKSVMAHIHINVEIKAKSGNQEAIRELLKSKGADFKGVDHQTDTYFKAKDGRLKMREGNIENSLIYYQRENKAGPKQSDVILYKTEAESGSSLKRILEHALEVRVVVDKTREIYFIGNVKFHIDSVKGLGTFVEIEAIDKDGTIGREKLLEQCRYYLELFGISDEDLVMGSYSDMIGG